MRALVDIRKVALEKNPVRDADGKQQGKKCTASIKDPSVLLRMKDMIVRFANTVFFEHALKFR